MYKTVYNITNRNKRETHTDTQVCVLAIMMMLLIIDIIYYWPCVRHYVFTYTQSQKENPPEITKDFFRFEVLREIKKRSFRC